MSFLGSRNSAKPKDIGRELDNLRSDLRSVRSDLKRVVQAVGHSGRKSASKAGNRWWENARDLEERVEEGLYDTYEQVYDQAHDAVESAREELAKRPFIVMAVALGAGLLFTELLRRSIR